LEGERTNVCADTGKKNEERRVVFVFFYFIYLISLEMKRKSRKRKFGRLTRGVLTENTVFLVQ